MIEGIIPGNRFKRMVGRTLAIFLNRRDRKIKQSMVDSAEVIIQQAQSVYLTGGSLNVRTGRLRSSLTRTEPRVLGKRYEIQYGTDVIYGRYWELNQQDPRPWLRPAEDDMRPEIGRLLAKVGIQIQ